MDGEMSSFERRTDIDVCGGSPSKMPGGEEGEQNRARDHGDGDHADQIVGGHR